MGGGREGEWGILIRTLLNDIYNIKELKFSGKDITRLKQYYRTVINLIKLPQKLKVAPNGKSCQKVAAQLVAWVTQCHLSLYFSGPCRKQGGEKSHTASFRFNSTIRRTRKPFLSCQLLISLMGILRTLRICNNYVIF